MDNDLFKAAAKGNIEPFNKTAQNLGQIVSQFRDTILHINIKAQKKTAVSTEFVEQVLDRSPSLLLQLNDKDDTPLLVAAKRGHVAIVKVLIKRAKARYGDLESGAVAARQMLRMTNKEGNTALHEAARNNCIQVVELLTKEDPDFSYSPNNEGETPIYIAALRGNLSIVDEILETCSSPAHEGPKGMTSLHAIVMTNNRARTRKILKKKTNLTRELTEQNGWTPLHIAAYYGYFNTAQELLKCDESAAYIGDKDRNMTALHLAASQGHEDIIKEIIFHSPKCYDLIDKRGWNVLHFAMVSLRVRALKTLLRNPLLSSLINEKDAKGNTPLHVLAASHPGSFDNAIRGVRCDHLAVINMQNYRVEDILRHVSPELKKEILDLSQNDGGGSYPLNVICVRDKVEEKKQDNIEEAKESQLIVAALIATVTFTAAFTLPGGYKTDEGPEQGTAILTKNSAFQVFVITNSMALISCVYAVLINFIVSFHRFRKYMYMLRIASSFTILAMGAMVVAFIAGTIAVMPSSAMAIGLVGITFFSMVAFLVYNIRSSYL